MNAQSHFFWKRQAETEALVFFPFLLIVSINTLNTREENLTSDIASVIIFSCRVISSDIIFPCVQIASILILFWLRPGSWRKSFLQLLSSIYYNQVTWFASLPSSLTQFNRCCCQFLVNCFKVREVHQFWMFFFCFSVMLYIVSYTCKSPNLLES